MNVVEATIEVLLRDNPNMTRAEAARLAQEQHAPESRTDGAPSAQLTPDVQLDYPEQQYRYNPVSRTWDDVYEEAASRSAEQDRQAQAGAHGYRWGGKVPHASDEAAADYSTRPANGPSQQDMDMLQTGEYNQSGTGWVEYYDPQTGVTVKGRRAPVPDSYTPGNPGYKTASEMRASNDPAYVPAEDTPGANLAAGYAGATGFRDWTVDGPIPEYAQGYDWGGVEQGWANEATGGGRIGRGVSNRDVQREMPQVLESPSGRPEYTRKPKLMNGPNGPVWVYMYDEESQSTRDENAKAQKDELQIRRMAEKAGISMAEARALKESGGAPGDPMRGIRDLILDRRREDKEARRKAYTDRNMLAGNDPRQNLVNAYNTLDPEAQQQAMLGMMFPDGATPLDVEQARAMAEARLNANQALSDPLAQQMREQQLRQANPAAAGASDIASGQYNTPEALAELERITVQHDTTNGGFSYQDERNLAATLQGPPYNLGQAEAEALAYQQAQTRRWVSGNPPAQGPAGPGGELPAGRQQPTPPVEQPLPPPGMWGNFPPSMPPPRQWGPTGPGATGPSAWGGAGG